LELVNNDGDRARAAKVMGISPRTHSSRTRSMR
jgi:hypothetical protein